MPRPDLAAGVDGLGLPGPKRASILEEIAGDLEEMRSELVRRGMGPEEAEQEAFRLLAPSEAAIAALASVHEPLYASLARRFSSEMRLAEWVGLVGVTLVAIGMSVGSLVLAGVLRSPSPVLLPLLAVTAAVFVMSGRKAVQLHLAGDHRPERLDAGMGAILVGSGLAVLLGFGGATYELQRLAGRLQVEPRRTGELVLPWLLDTSVLMGAGLATALVGGLAWFLLQQKILAVVGADLRATRAVRSAAASVTNDPFHRSTTMNAMLPLLTVVQQYTLTDSTGRVARTAEAYPMAFSDMGVMRWPITFCLVMVVVLAVQAALRIESGEPERKVLARATIDGSLFWGAYAAVLGVLGTVVGFMVAAQSVEALGDVETSLVWGGVKVALSTTVYGLLIFLLSALAWFGLRGWHRRSVLSGA